MFGFSNFIRFWSFSRFNKFVLSGINTLLSLILKDDFKVEIPSFNTRGGRDRMGGFALFLPLSSFIGLAKQYK